MIIETLPRFWQVLLGLKGYEVHKTYSAEECLNKVNELDGKSGYRLRRRKNSG